MRFLNYHSRYGDYGNKLYENVSGTDSGEFFRLIDRQYKFKGFKNMNFDLKSRRNV